MSKVEANSISEIFSEAKKKLSSMSTDELQVENDTSDKLAFDVQKFIGMLQDQNRALAGMVLVDYAKVGLGPVTGSITCKL